MSNTLKVAVAVSAGVVGTCAATLAQAQNLTAFVNDPSVNATTLQRETGIAVQNMCLRLTAQGGAALDGTPRGDLFRRCQEMVQSANQIVRNGATVRSMNYTPAELLKAIQQVSGEEIAAQGSLATQVSSGQFGNIAGRLNALRLGTTTASARGRVARLGNDKETYLADARAQPMSFSGGGASADAAGVQKPFGWFFESSYGFGDHDQTASEDAFDYDAVSVSVGSDYNFGNAVVGIAFGYDRYTSDFDKATLVSGGNVEVKGTSGSLFGAWSMGGWTLNGIASYGSLESDITRRVEYTSNSATCVPTCGAVRSLSGSPDGSYVAAGVTVGYEFNAGGWEFSPSLSASYRDVDIDGYAERDSVANGGLALAYEDQSIESKRTIVGFGIARPISRTFGVLVPNLRLEWHHEFEDDARALSVKYAIDDSAPRCIGATSCFTFRTDAPEADFAVASIGVSAVFAQRFQAYAFYEALLGVADYSSNSIAVGLRGQF